MKLNKSNKNRSKKRQRPNGMVLVNGKYVYKKSKDKNGIPLMPDAPTRGLVLSEDRCATILKTHSVFLDWTSLRKTSPLFGLDVRKPLYLVSQKKNGSTQVVGIVTAKNMDSGAKTRIALKRAFAPVRNVDLKEKPVDLIVQKRHMTFRMEQKAKPFVPAAGSGDSVQPVEIKSSSSGEDVVKVLSDSVDNPRSEGGSHTHSLIRSEARTMNNGQHFHILDHPEFGRLVSDIDGQHFHTLDGDTTGSDASPHGHVFGLPNGEVIRTEVDGVHDHDVLMRRTDNGGVHVHKIKVNEETMATLSSTEEAMEMGPGMGDPADAPEGVERLPAEMGLVEAMEKHLDDIDENFERAVLESESWTIKVMVEKQTTIQSVVLSKTRFSTLDLAREWVRDNGFKDDKVDEKPNTFRFRQFPPGRCEEGTFRNKRITRGVIGVICVPKGNNSSKDQPSKPGNQMAKDMQKKVIEQSKVRVDSRMTGFSFQRKDGILFAFKDPVNGKADGKPQTLIVRQRLGTSGMDSAPVDAVDAMEVFDAPNEKPAKELAKENIGSLVLVLQRVKGSDKMKEVEGYIAVIDPTKGAPEKDCGCPD